MHRFESLAGRNWILVRMVGGALLPHKGTIWILNRADGSEVGSVGHKGHGAGELDRPECMARDAHNNLYVTEVGAIMRIQKFAAK